ncbi:MAG: hypothetical protein J6336_07915 [Kiritimatiellae bacterium]|nr:hypothetical protein [Kiritimatiellia bacterium]
MRRFWVFFAIGAVIGGLAVYGLLGRGKGVPSQTDPEVSTSPATVGPKARKPAPVRKETASVSEREDVRGKAGRAVSVPQPDDEPVPDEMDAVLQAVEVTDIKRFFSLSKSSSAARISNPPHLLYLGRRHPLKGTVYLEEVVRDLGDRVELRMESAAFGEEKERVWAWCDVLVLPTLSDNFGLVIAEALERGKRVITTDGAPTWGEGGDFGGRLVYLKGYRDGTRADRVRLLKDAIKVVTQK